RPFGPTGPGLGAGGRPHLRIPHRPVPQGPVGPRPHPRPRHRRGPGRPPLHSTDLAVLPPPAGPPTAPVRQSNPTAPGPLFRLPRSRVRPEPRPPPALAPVPAPGLRQGPRMAGPANGAEEPGLHPAAQRVHPTRRPRRGATLGR